MSSYGIMKNNIGYKFTGKKLSRKELQELRKQRLLKAREKGIHTKEQWYRLCHEFEYKCVKCWKKPSLLTKDHIIPLYMKESSDDIENIQPLCKKCNFGKRDDFNWIIFRRMWLKNKSLKSPDDINREKIIRLMRLEKTKDEIIEILGITHNQYYVLRRNLGIEREKVLGIEDNC